MSLFVRKINKRRYIDIIKKYDDVGETDADFVTSELRTRDNTLSIWAIESREDMGPAILAIALSSSRIETMDFIAFGPERLEALGLDIRKSEPGVNPYTKAMDMHYDIYNLRLHSLAKLTELYKRTENRDFIRINKKDIDELVKKAKTCGYINMDNVSPEMRRYLDDIGEGNHALPI
jgi:hypothetical protein